MFDQREDRPAESEGAQGGADPVDASVGAALVALAEGVEEPQGDADRYDVDDEREPPRQVVDEDAADEGPDDHGAGGHGRPDADRPAAHRAVEARGDERQRAGNEERARRTLHGAGDDQDDGVWRDRDHDGCRGESVEADAQHEQPAEGIRDRTGEQDE